MLNWKEGTICRACGSLEIGTKAPKVSCASICAASTLIAPNPCQHGICWWCPRDCTSYVTLWQGKLRKVGLRLFDQSNTAQSISIDHSLFYLPKKTTLDTFGQINPQIKQTAESICGVSANHPRHVHVEIGEGHSRNGSTLVHYDLRGHESHMCNPHVQPMARRGFTVHFSETVTTDLQWPGLKRRSCLLHQGRSTVDQQVVGEAL